MCPGAKSNLLLLRQRCVSVDRHVVQNSKWRNGAELAIWEGVLKVAFRRNLNRSAARQSSQAAQVDMRGCRDDRHRQLAIKFDDHRLGQLFTGNMRQRRYTLRGVGLRVRENQILDLMRIEIFAKFGKLHGTSSVEW